MEHVEEQDADVKQGRLVPPFQVKQQERAVLKLCQKYEQGIKDVQRDMGSLRENITEEFHELYHFLLGEENATMATIRQEETAALCYMDDKVQELTGLLEDLLECPMTEECMEDLEEKLHQKREELHQKREELQFVHLEVMGSLPLQHRVWKRMRSIVQPSLEPLSLDPQTAHPHLTLSKNLRAVRLGSSAQPVHAHPKCFETCLYVLASQGFLSGRHYWEVEVGDKTNWIIGVASGSGGRKLGSSSVGCMVAKDLSPENGYWVLSKYHGELYCALTILPVPFKLKSSPTRIGVYLDLQSANMGFYDAESMVQIFAFKDDFKKGEELYPFFCPGQLLEESDYEPLRVCVV